MNKLPSPEPGALDRFIGFLETHNGQRIAICVYSIVATAVLLLFSGETVAYVFGIPYMFFIPGLALARLFFWKKTSVEARFVLSLGLSVLAIILLGLILVYTIGLGQDSTRASLIIFTLAAVALETFWLRADKPDTVRLPEAEKPSEAVVEPRLKIDKVVAAMLAASLVISGISFGLIVAADYPPTTSFSVTDSESMIFTNITLFVDTNLTLLVHVKNGEDGPRNFTIWSYEGTGSGLFAPRSYNEYLLKGERWDQPVNFTLYRVGSFRLDFDLYIQKGDGPPILYGNLHIWIFVWPPEN